MLSFKRLLSPWRDGGGIISDIEIIFTIKLFQMWFIFEWCGQNKHFLPVCHWCACMSLSRRYCIWKPIQINSNYLQSAWPDTVRGTLGHWAFRWVSSLLFWDTAGSQSVILIKPVSCVHAVHSSPPKRMYALYHTTYNGNTALSRNLHHYNRFLSLLILIPHNSAHHSRSNM